MDRAKEVECIRINWFRVCCDLKAARRSFSKIEKDTGIARTTLFGWKSGSEPRHCEGELLINYWMEVTGKAREDLPMEVRFQTAYRRKH